MMRILFTNIKRFTCADNMILTVKIEITTNGDSSYADKNNATESGEKYLKI